MDLDLIAFRRARAAAVAYQMRIYRMLASVGVIGLPRS